MDELLAIPLELGTPAQRARLYELISASSQARRRKWKKRRKKKAPNSSSFRSSSGVRPRRCGHGSRSRSSSSGGCGRLREHVRQVSAVAVLQWKVPPSISSTKWWTFQLCYGDRYGCLQVQFSDKVVSLPSVVLQLALLVQRVQKPVEFPQVQFMDKVVFLPGIVPDRPPCRFDWCSSWRRRSSSSLSWCKGRSPWSRLFQQTTEISPLQYIDEVIDALVLALIVQTVQLHVEVPQVQYLDKDVLMPVIARVRCDVLWW